MHSYRSWNAPGSILRSLTGISPLSSGLLAHVASLQKFSFTIHPLADCFPVGALQDFWSWRDLLTGDPLLVPLGQRVQCLRRIEAQCARDQNRAQRLDPPIWEDVTMSFASKVLRLPCLPRSSRGHYEKLLHKRHWTVGHNSSKEATTTLDRQTLLTCARPASHQTAATMTRMITSFFFAPTPSFINAEQP